jgi:hypothetical protein
VVKSVQYGVRHNSASSVETMPLALELHKEIQGRIGKAGPRKKSAVGLDYKAAAKTAVFFEDADSYAKLRLLVPNQKAPGMTSTPHPAGRW